MPNDGETPPFRKIDDATARTPPENPVRRRVIRLKRWIILDVNRNVLAGLLLGGSFVTIVLVGSFGPVSVESFLTAGVSPGTVLVELLKAIVSVIVIVLSINQLVLSPGLGPVGEQEERFEQSMDLRQRVESQTDIEVIPASPAMFLVALLDAIIDQAEQLDEIASQSGTLTIQPELTEYLNTVIDDAKHVRGRLVSGRFGEFEVISAALRFAMSEKIQLLRAFQQTVDELPEDSFSAAFDELDELFELFTVTREYLKTIYIRDEYIRLSEELLYTGLPAILVTYCAAQIYTPTVFPGEILGLEKQLLFVSGAVTVALTPLAVLLSYIFRLTPLSRSTLFIGPFDARPTEDDREESHNRGQYREHRR